MLLKYGADPHAVDASGQTSLLELAYIENTAHSFPGMFLKAVVHAAGWQRDPAAIIEIRNLLEAQGCTLDIDDKGLTAAGRKTYFDNAKTTDIVWTVQSEMAQIYLKAFRIFIEDYIHTTNPYAIIQHIVTTMLNSAANLLIWAMKREGKAIRDDELPEGWAEFFHTSFENDDFKGLAEYFKEEDIPVVRVELNKLAVKVCIWLAEHEAALAAMDLVHVLVEVVASGMIPDWIERGIPAAKWLFTTIFRDKKLTFIDHVRLKMNSTILWQLARKGQLLDKSHKVISQLGLAPLIDDLIKAVAKQALDNVPKMSSSILTDLVLPTRFPQATTFITTKSRYGRLERLTQTLLQLFALLLPWLLLIPFTYRDYRALRYGNLNIIHFVSQWAFGSRLAFFDEKIRFNRLMLHRVRIAWELICFRVTCGFEVEEPVVLVCQERVKQASTVEKLEAMKTWALFPVWWIPFREEDGWDRPAPCYPAMGEVMRAWKEERLGMAEAWRDGWWEVGVSQTEPGGGVEGKKRWERVDVKVPSWSDYTEASTKIKVSASLELVLCSTLVMLDLRLILSRL